MRFASTDQIADSLNGRLPILVQAGDPRIDLLAWLDENRAELNAELHRSGGVLLRGFAGEGVDGFDRFVTSFRGGAMDYLDRVTKRNVVSGRILSSTEAPPHFTIAMHSESSFAANWPGELLLHCIQPAASGGRTPIADTRRIYELIPAPIRERFEDLGVLYVRNFGGGPGMSWQETFGVADSAELEQRCRDAGIEAIWRGGDRLQTRQVRPAVARHPATGETVWFNHAMTLHVSSLDPLLAKMLLRQYGEDNLPHQTFYGDGAPIDNETISIVRRAYEASSVHIDWQRGDTLVLDNMLTAHGREAYKGERKVLAALTSPLVWAQVEGGRGTVCPANAADEPHAVGTAPESEADSTTIAADPQRRVRDSLLSTAREFLGQPDLAETDDLLDRGCDSVTIVRIIARVEEETGSELSLRAFFTSPTVQQIAAAQAPGGC